MRLLKPYLILKFVDMIEMIFLAYNGGYTIPFACLVDLPVWSILHCFLFFPTCFMIYLLVA